MILIISADNDTVSDSICNWLSMNDKQFIRINSNHPITGIHFDFNTSSHFISINGNKFSLKDITSVFYRNGDITFQNFWWNLDENMEKFFFSEYKSIADFISYFLENQEPRFTETFV